MQFWSGEIEAKKSPKNWIWEGLGLHLERVWDGLELHLAGLEEGLGRLLGALGRLLAYLPWKPPLFELGTVGHQFDVSPVCCEKVLWDLDWQCEGFVAHFCFILYVLGRLLVSFWLSCDACGPHLGPLGAPFWPKLAQVGPR